MGTIQNLNNKATQTTFNKKLLSANQYLHPYVKHRLYIGESTGIIPKNMYSSGGIIDDCIANLYENGYNVDNNAETLKLKLFKMVDAHLEHIFKTEAFHKNTISTTPLLEDELNRLEEKYTIDDGFEFVMNEELNDISYQQSDYQKKDFTYNDDNTVISTFTNRDATNPNHKKIIGNMYRGLPLNVSNIIDLYAFGKLTVTEIAQIKNLETKRIERIIKTVEQTFETHIG